jgi:OmcA/MtrC family decaheme c-type cytochrome
MLALAATIGLAGCDGDSVGDAAAGPTGPTGGVGPTGPTGPTVPPVPDIGQGGPVTIGNGSALTAEQIAAIDTLVATLDSAAITNNRAVIEFTVETAKGGPVLGLAPTTLRLGIAKLVPAAAAVPSRWQSYVNRLATPGNTSAGFVPALPNAIQANAESGVAGDCAVATAACWQELGDGKYRYRSAVDLSAVTSPIAVPYDPSLTHRVSIAIDLSAPARGLAPDNPFLDFVPAGGSVTSNKLIAATANCADCHVRFAEHGGSRRSNEYCVVCHNPGSIDPDGGESVDMAYMAHSIHRAGDRATPYVVFGFGGTKYSFENVTYPQSVLFCETCHTQSADAPQGNDWLVNATASTCGGCHVDGLLKTGPDAATGRYVYQFQHTIASSGFDFAANDGDCLGCHRAGGVAGETLEVHRQGDRLAVELGRAYQYSILSATNTAAGQTPTVTFQILKDGQPIDVKALTTGRLRLDFAWSTDDIHNVADLTPGQEQYLNNEGEALEIEFVASGGQTANMAAVVDNGNGTFSYTLASPLPAGVNGDIMVVLEGRREENGTRAYPSSAIFFPGEKRVSLVEQAKCENCHEFIAAHGGSRAGDPNVCILCHNSSGGFAEEGIGPIAFGAWMHNLHNSVLGEITYPQSLARCETCHKPGSYNTARETALPISTAAGADGRAVNDDTWDSATAGTCRGCHGSGSALAHMTQNGGVIDQVGGKQLMPSTSTESCAVCHGEGRSVDTAKAHAAHAE